LASLADFRIGFIGRTREGGKSLNLLQKTLAGGVGNST
jgi:hypothetical protein